MEKSTLHKKLKSYSALAGTLIAAGTTAEAQIVYTDVSPDATVATGATYDLDLDNNSVVDFQFALVHDTYVLTGTFGTFPIAYDFAVIVPNTDNAIDTVSSPESGPAPHVVNDPIGSGLLFVDASVASYQLLGIAYAGSLAAYNHGNFLGQNDKYIGLRFKIGTNDHYGWVRVDLNADATLLTIKDYAYDATPNTGLLAGATATSINDNLAAAVTVFSENKNIHVNMNKSSVEGVVTVTDVLGKVVTTMNITSNANVISLDNAQAGIYFVSVSQGDARFTKKVIIK
jgi:hypothetical protein